MSPEVLLDINSLSATQYTIDVYRSAQAGPREIVGYGGIPRQPRYGRYTVTGNSVATYTISQINDGNGVSITWQHDGTTWETRLVKNGNVWTHTDWHVQGATPNRYTTTTYNGTTSATVVKTGPNAIGTGQESPLSWAKTFATFPWGNELVRRQTGSLFTSYDYYTATDSNGGFQGQLKSRINEDGSWALYKYNASGLVQTVLRPWLDGPANPSAATASNSVSENYTYNGTDSTYLESHITSAPGGVQLSKTTWSYNFSSGTLTDSTGTAHTLLTTTRKDFYSASSLTTVSKFFKKDDPDSYLRNQTVSVAYPSGRQDSFAYYIGIWNPSSRTFAASADPATAGADRLIVTFHGQTAAGSGSSTGTSVSSWSYGGVTANIISLYLVPNLSTFTETVVDTTGRVVFTAENVFTAANTLNRIAGTLKRFDALGRVTEEVDIARTNGANEFRTSYSYQAGLLATVTGPEGIPARMTYDPLLRLVSKTVGADGDSSYPARVTQYRYDGADRLAREGTGTSPAAWTVRSYDSSGRISRIEEPGPGVTLVTSYAYPDLRTTTVTLPGLATRTTATYLDGRPKSVTGTAQAPVYYEYAANGTGLLTRTGHRPPTGSISGQTLGWTEEQKDYLGRTVLQSRPAWNWTGSNANIVDVSSTYDAAGNLAKTRTIYRADGTPLLPDHLYTHDVAGRLVQDGLDVNNSGTLEAVSTDRLNAYRQTFVKDGSGWTREEVTTTAPEASAGLTVTATKTVTRLTGFTYNAGVWGTADVTSYDASGRSTRTQESVQPAARTRTGTLQTGGVATVGRTVWLNGLLSSTVSNSGVREEYRYDSLGRLSTHRWRFDGTAYRVGKTFAYFGSTQYQQSVNDQGSTTTFAYAWGTDGSRTITTTDALSRTTRSMLNAMGLPWRTWGSATFPSEITYDALGRRQSLTTWRGGDFTGSTWSAAPGSGDTTTWTLDPATGLVNTKTFANANRVDFTYAPLGQTATRQGARTLPGSSTRIQTTYSYYDGSAAAGGPGFRTQELRRTDYNDGTPAVAYTYKRSGALASVQDFTGTRTFGYRSADARPDYEQLDPFYNARRITAGYETGASVGRPNLLQVGTAGSPAADYRTAFGYTDTRITSISGTSAGNPVRNFSIGYVPYSDRVQQVSESTAAYSYRRTWEPTRDLVQTITSQAGGPILAQFDYQYNAALQATSVANTGTIFSLYGSGTGVVTRFGYDSRSQLTSEQSYLGTNPADTGNPLAGRALNPVAYDNQGNRTSLALNGHTAGYMPNNLNQYSARTNPGVVTVSGAADAGDPVEVNGEPVEASGRQGGYFRKDVMIDNSAGPNLTPVRVTSGDNPDQARASLRPNYLSAANESFVYDADGNLVSDDRWNYSYDAENRLAEMTTRPAALAAGARNQRLTFRYDYLDRRVKKTVEHNEANGFLGQYFAGPGFRSVHHLRTDPQLWFTGPDAGFPGAGQAPDDFSVCWSGYIVPPATGNYQFRFTVNDRFRLWINGQLVQQSWHDQDTASYVTVPLPLTAGDHVFVQAEYYQHDGAAAAGLEWNVPGQGWQVIPQARVFSPPLAASGVWRTVSETAFLYSGNNLVAEIQGGTVIRSYTWGLDLSGTMQGAGGTGGLLMISEGGESYFPVCDRMGNIHGLARGSDGNLAAIYEYNAFGEILRQYGDYAAANPLGWNTKYTDRETGMVYFGRRFYRPDLGRFINRDPIQEAGGLNLHAMAGNDPVNRFDVLGLDAPPIVLPPINITVPPLPPIPIPVLPVPPPPPPPYQPSLPPPLIPQVPPTGRPPSSGGGTQSPGGTGSGTSGGSGYFWETVIPSEGDFYSAWDLEFRLALANTSLSGSILAGEIMVYSYDNMDPAGFGNGSAVQASSSGWGSAVWNYVKQDFRNSMQWATLALGTFFEGINQWRDLTVEVAHTTGFMDPQMAGAMFDGGLLLAPSLLATKPASVVAAAETAAPKAYSVAYRTRLAPESYPGASRAAHFQEANGNLLRAMEGDASFAKSIRDLGINLERTPTGLVPRQSPANWTWHHAESLGELQLVPRVQHTPGSAFWDILHPGGQGGYSIWGK
ncbi:hypothetical protein OPIT5_01600 [Opitutaceae bacterium TAV5]|nr:hypothetical protein OPIT5_01600 [Opitutaceae bacterium TAV5]